MGITTPVSKLLEFDYLLMSSENTRTHNIVCISIKKALNVAVGRPQCLCSTALHKLKTLYSLACLQIDTGRRVYTTKTLQGQGVMPLTTPKGQIEYKIQYNGPMHSSLLSSTLLTKITSYFL